MSRSCRRPDGFYNIREGITECVLKLLRSKPTASNHVLGKHLMDAGYSSNYQDMAGADARRVLGIVSNAKFPDRRTIDRVKFLANGGDPNVSLPSNWRWVNDDRSEPGPPIPLDAIVAETVNHMHTFMLPVDPIERIHVECNFPIAHIRNIDGFVSAELKIDENSAVLTVTRRVTQSETVEV